jgi:hypothetical protein
MNARLFAIGTLAGALTLFAWETVSNAALPWHAATMRTFQDSTAAVQAIRSHAPENGLYMDTRGVVAAISFTPGMADKSTMLGKMLGRQLVLDVLVAFAFLFAMTRLPRAATAQYAAAFAIAAFAISASTFGSNWNWWGYPAPWSLVQVVDRTIGFALMGLVLGALFNRWVPRPTTDEWGGVRASGSLPASHGAPTANAGR